MKIDYSNCRDFIKAKEIILGKNIEIGERTIIAGIQGDAERVIIGDNVFIDKDCVILVPQFFIGDYSKIFKQCRISGYQPCKIGYNFWMDQNCILNSTDNMTIGNNVGIGAYSQLWTHIKHGDILEGCRFNSTKEMIIGDDVWFVGHCIVSPIVAQNKSMAMVGSVITKNMIENHIYAGCPAIDITEKIGTQFSPKSIDEKIKMLTEKIIEFCHLNTGIPEDIFVVVEEFPENMDNTKTYFSIKRRMYSKRGTPEEIKFMKYLLPLYKFIPYV